MHDAPLEQQDSGTYLFVRAGTPSPRKLAPEPSSVPLAIPRLDSGVLGQQAPAAGKDRIRYRRVPVESHRWDRRLAVALAPEGAAAAAFRQLAERVNTGVVWVSSPIAGAGRTAVVANLALALAPTRRVTIVDADLWQPAVAQAFALPVMRGLGALLRERRRDPLAPIDLTLVTPSLAVLPAGEALDARTAERIFAMPELERVLAEVACVSDVVLVDAPPITPVTAPILAQRQGSVLLVAPPAGWDDGSLRAAFDALGNPTARVVLNRT